MTPTDWAALIVSIAAVVGAFAGAVRWLVKHYLFELKPNGGESMRDSIIANTERLNRVEERIDQIFLLLSTKGKK
jgi:hypothetical protein